MYSYWFGRQLEIDQGWLYNYFIFLDEDLDWQGRSMYTFYETFLWNWQPAMATPGSAHHQATSEATSVNGLDSNFHSLNRESVEVLLPMILEFESSCIFASLALLQFEASLAYRNHLLVPGGKAILVENLDHRRGSEHPEACFLIINKTMSNLYELIPQSLRHCARPDALDYIPNRKAVCSDIDQAGGRQCNWLPCGISKKKQPFTRYHLMNDHAPYSDLNFAHEDQNCSTETFNCKDDDCCTIDATGLWDMDIHQ
jgi:hypothetical protein